MYFINKIVGWALSPLGMLFLGLGLAWLLRRAGQRLGREGRVLQWKRLKVTPQGLLVAAKWLAIGMPALLWVLGCGLTTRLIGPALEGAEPPPGEAAAPGEYDAVVLLGGGVGAHHDCGRTELFAGADRVLEAARVWKAQGGGELKLTLSGGEVERSTVPLLRELGVAESAMMLFPDARNTAEEAAQIRAKFGEHPRILLVTSAWHMPRAKLLFERAGFAVTPRPTDYELHFVAEEPIGIGDFFPNAEALVRNSYALKEWVARLGYAVLRR